MENDGRKLSGRIVGVFSTGLAGEPGAVFVPSVDENGILSWTNNGGLDNPAPIKIVGDSTNVDFQYGTSTSATTPPQNWYGEIPAPNKDFPYLWIKITLEEDAGTVVNQGVLGYYQQSGVGGLNVGGVKNGGNVVISPDGTMNAPVYTLPIANAETLGGVKPDAATEGMTKPVGVNAEGKLFTTTEVRLYATASGDSAVTSLNVPKALVPDDFTKIVLNTFRANSNDVFTFADGGIRMPRAGTVMVWATVYFTSPTNATPQVVGPYIMKNGEEVIGQLTYSRSVTGVHVMPLMLQVEEGDVMTLYARCSDDDAVCNPSAKATYLAVQYL